MVGSGSQARYVIDICVDSGPYDVVGLADVETEKNVGRVVNGVSVRWVLARLIREVAPSLVKVIVAYGKHDTKREVVEELSRAGFQFATVISPLASISRWATIDVGTIVNPLAAVLPNARIGQHVVVHSHAVVEHDNVLEDYVNVAPGVSLGGNVSIGEAAYVYTGASVRPGIVVGRGAIVAAGAAVVKDVPAGAVVAGVPAVPMRKSQTPAQ